ncbi:hypothetical protein ARMSODRAFT_1017170 [Armillaria solidipes]|uniref:Uncharacterized protein n=1 Tax=Armillaria solidipes TaxID=1076256 RepID=A0A2H3C7J5_9AGAR|nr:hypothetical protein ARMSODRAFT_1017170 [Armillaria solidipes]
MTFIDEHEPLPSSSNSSSTLGSASLSHVGGLGDDAKLSVLYRRRNHIEVSDSVDPSLVLCHHPCGWSFESEPPGKPSHPSPGAPRKTSMSRSKPPKEAYKKSWGLGAQRGRYLSKLADLVEQNIDEMSALETLNVGKPFTVAKNNDLIQ